MIRPQTVSRYASMVKFSHTIFAMPFALVGYAYALQTTDAEFSLLLLVKVLLAMVFARNTAMGFNRYADRRIDALNPRTRNREIPAGIITPRRALIFVIVNAALFLAVALWINRLAFFPRAGSTAGAGRIQFYETFYGLVSHRVASRSESLRWALTSR